MKTQNFDFRIYNTEEKKYIDRNGYVQKYNVDNYFVVLVKDSFQILKIRDMTKEMNIDSKNYWMAEYSTIKDVTNICEIELFTGLCDKNGNKIYEGDILYYFKDCSEGEVFKYQVLFKEGAFYLFESYDDFVDDEDLISEFDLKELQVMGNIHENSELIKGIE